MKRCAALPPAVVVGVTDAVGLGLVRDLGLEGIPVIAMGPVRGASALASRYCLPARCAQPRGDSRELLGDLTALASRLGRRAVLFAADDAYVAALSRHKLELQEQFWVPTPDWERLSQLADKERQLELARGAGVTVPTTAVLRSAGDVGPAAQAVPFPAVLKPIRPNVLRGRTGLKAIRVDRPEELAAAYERTSFCGTLLLQEVIPGPDDHVLIAGTYHDAQGRPLAIFTGRKLRQHPRGFGDTRAGESRWSQELADVTLRLLAAARYHGISDVEFKRDSRDGRLKLMEVNARHGLWTPLARTAGVNLASIAYHDVIGRPLGARRQVDGVRWIDLLHDGPDSLKEMLRREMAPAEWLASLGRVRADGVLSLRDPLPGLLETRRIVRSHMRRRIKRSTARQ